MRPAVGMPASGREQPQITPITQTVLRRSGFA